MIAKLVDGPDWNEGDDKADPDNEYQKYRVLVVTPENANERDDLRAWIAANEWEMVVEEGK